MIQIDKQIGKKLNNLHYNKTLEDHYLQEKFDQIQTLFISFQFNKLYTVTFIFMPADKNWICDPF